MVKALACGESKHFNVLMTFQTADYLPPHQLQPVLDSLPRAWGGVRRMITLLKDKGKPETFGTVGLPTIKEIKTYSNIPSACVAWKVPEKRKDGCCRLGEREVYNAYSRVK